MNYKELDSTYISNTYKRQNVVIAQGKGSTAVDLDGKQYIDFTSGIGVNSLGFCNENWVNAITKQANTLQHTSNLYYTT
ncbi:MAG: aminotransferase class III-fold pyridoxal phosphate-dependent enzyme, partial [Eubacteriales bacterium]